MAEAAYADPGDSPTRRRDIAYAMGADGTPAPRWVVEDDQAWGAYKRGLATHHTVLPFAPPRRRSSGTRAGRAPRRPAAPRAAEPAPGAGRWWARPNQALRNAAPKAAGAFSGDAGGLLLALILYPLVLATVQYGAAGPGAWFRAKWLNDVDTSLTPTGSATTADQGELPTTQKQQLKKHKPAPSTPGSSGTNPKTGGA